MYRKIIARVLISSFLSRWKKRFSRLQRAIKRISENVTTFFHLYYIIIRLMMKKSLLWERPGGNSRAVPRRAPFREVDHSGRWLRGGSISHAILKACASMYRDPFWLHLTDVCITWLSRILTGGLAGPRLVLPIGQAWSLAASRTFDR